MGRRSLGHLGEIDPKDWKLEPDFMLGPFWLGDFAPELSTKDYGSNDFHGRFHPAIPWVAMRRFTKPGDVVWDCFAGSGTTVDVGIELGRQVIASDLHPARNDILCRDATRWHPDKPVDLGIMHPPYMHIIDYDSPMSDDNGNVDGYRDEFAECFSHMNEVLKNRHVVVIVIGEVWIDGKLIPLEYHVDNVIADWYDYRLIGRIVKDFGYTKGGKSKSGKHSNLWKYRLLKFGYFRYGIDTILFYQKPGG